mmetsp:Transcript_19489/g.54325  ORF Transcript_19489/g.54325 Transcript_19489/m.54325 type:complete len:89 (-) Transcript_19489:1503-1769(-)
MTGGVEVVGWSGTQKWTMENSCKISGFSEFSRSLTAAEHNRDLFQEGFSTTKLGRLMSMICIFIIELPMTNPVAVVAKMMTYALRGHR